MNFVPIRINHPEHQGTFETPRDAAMLLQPQLPLLCFSPERLKQQISLFQSSFPGKVTYAVKANPSTTVLRVAAQAGISTFDVASLPEMELVRSIAPNAKLHYHNPVRSSTENYDAYHRFGCKRFAIDELNELLKLRKQLPQAKNVEVAIRFRLPSKTNAVHDFSTKFGASPEMAILLVQKANELGFIPILTFHPGSQCLDPQSWKTHIDTAAKIARISDTKIEKLNVGGGFPAKYAAHEMPDLMEFFNQIATTSSQAFESDKTPALECEPGRALVASSTSIITRVKMVRQQSAEVFINDGIYGSFMESDQAHQLQPVANLIRNKSRPASSNKPFVVYGPTCDPLDRLPNPVTLPSDIQENDFIEFTNVGAYGQATTTMFNGYGTSLFAHVKDC